MSATMTAAPASSSGRWRSAIARRRSKASAARPRPSSAFDGAFKRPRRATRPRSACARSPTAQCPMVDFLRRLGPRRRPQPARCRSAPSPSRAATSLNGLGREPIGEPEPRRPAHRRRRAGLQPRQLREAARAARRVFSLKLESTAASGAPVRPQTVLALVTPGAAAGPVGPQPGSGRRRLPRPAPGHRQSRRQGRHRHQVFSD
jgi:hypothetical protein